MNARRSAEGLKWPCDTLTHYRSDWPLRVLGQVARNENEVGRRNLAQYPAFSGSAAWDTLWRSCGPGGGAGRRWPLVIDERARRNLRVSSPHPRERSRDSGPRRPDRRRRGWDLHGPGGAGSVGRDVVVQGAVDPGEPGASGAERPRRPRVAGGAVDEPAS